MTSVKIKGRAKGIYYWVMPEFVALCPRHEKLAALELVQDYNIMRYLHNETGPATNLEWAGFFGEPEGYYLKGRRVDKRDFHKVQFNNRLEDILSD